MKQPVFSMESKAGYFSWQQLRWVLCWEIHWCKTEAVKTLQQDIKEGLAYAENAELAGRRWGGPEMLDTPPKFNITPEKWWLEDYFPIGKATFQGLYVKLREGTIFRW